MNIIEELRAGLKPKGTKPLVHLHLHGPVFWGEEFVNEALDEVE